VLDHLGRAAPVAEGRGGHRDDLRLGCPTGNPSWPTWLCASAFRERPDLTLVPRGQGFTHLLTSRCSTWMLTLVASATTCQCWRCIPIGVTGMPRSTARIGPGDALRSRKRLRVLQHELQLLGRLLEIETRPGARFAGARFLRRSRPATVTTRRGLIPGYARPAVHWSCPGYGGAYRHGYRRHARLPVDREQPSPSE